MRARLECVQAQYEKRKQEARIAQSLFEVSAASLGTPDGRLAMQKSNRHQQLVQRALSEYTAALLTFNDFILDGKVPEGSDESPNS